MVFAGFSERVEAAARELRSLQEPILVVGHLDTDGLCASAILTKTLDMLAKEYDVKILAQLSPAFIEQLPEYPSYVFLDGGSECDLPTPALVIDHHQTPGSERDGVFLLNPVLDGFDGGRDACAASTSWVLARALGRPDDSWAAIVGAVGDAHDKGGFCSLNEEAALDALERGTAESLEAPWLFGVYSKPLDQLFAASHDLKLPGVTKNLGGARGFFRSLDIDPGIRYCELSVDERSHLLEALEERKEGSSELITHYGLPWAQGPLRDCRQAATFLNACGRLNKPALGFSFLRGELAEDPQVILSEYRCALNKAISWYRRAGEPEVVREDGLVVVRAGDRIAPAIAGTLCSVLTRGSMVEEGTVVLALARYGDGLSKVSVRARSSDRDLLSLIRVACEVVGGECGGHRGAAGAIISSGFEGSFIEAFKKAL